MRADLQKGMQASVRRFEAACRKGLRQYCDAVTRYCQKEGVPPDV